MSETTPTITFKSVPVVPDDKPRKKAASIPAVGSVLTPAPLSESDAMLLLIERAARDATLDLDRMERIFKMREDMLQRQSAIAYATDMAKAQAACEPVARNKTNPHTRSKYADLAAIAESVLPVIHAHGFALSFSEFRSAEPNCLGIVCEISHSGGMSKRHEFNVPVDGAGMKGGTNKTDTQAYGSTFTYGRRYATLAVFNVAITDDDGNRQQPKPTPQREPGQPDPDEPISEADLAKLRADMDAAGIDIPAFCRYFNLEKLGDITNVNLPRANAAIRKKAAQK